MSVQVRTAQGRAHRLEPRPPYLSLMLAAMQRSVAYRLTVFLNLLSGLLWVVALYYLWRTVYGTNAVLDDFTWQEMRTYILVDYAVVSLLSYGSTARMMGTIKSGEIVSQLLHPINYLYAQFAMAVGTMLVEGLIGASLTLVLGVVLLQITFPATVTTAALFLVSVGLGYVVNFLTSYIVALLCFWTMNSLGLNWAKIAVVNILSGALIPIQFLPGFLRTVAYYAPFQGIVYTPLMIYLGKLEGTAIWTALLTQVVWIGIMLVLVRVLWKPALRTLEVQGG